MSDAIIIIIRIFATVTLGTMLGLGLGVLAYGYEFIEFLSPSRWLLKRKPQSAYSPKPGRSLMLTQTIDGITYVRGYAFIGAGVVVGDGAHIADGAVVPCQAFMDAITGGWQ